MSSQPSFVDVLRKRPGAEGPGSHAETKDCVKEVRSTGKDFQKDLQWSIPHTVTENMQRCYGLQTKTNHSNS